MFRPLKTFQLVVDLVAALGFFALFGYFLLPGGWSDEAWQVGVVTLGMAAALAVRRLSPALSLTVAWVAALLQMGLGLSPMGADIAVFGVLYVTAAYGSRAVFWAGFASSFAGAATIAVYLVFVTRFVSGGGPMWHDLPNAIFVLLSAAFALLLAWTVGALVRTAARARANRLAREVAESVAAAEQERVRIARDMHDVVAHSLAVVIAQADGARYAAASDPRAATAALGTISETARAALSDVRMLLAQLRHPHSLVPASSPARGTSDERGPGRGDGPQPGLTDLDALYDQVRAAGVDLRVEAAPAAPSDVPAAVQLAVFRILQEALTNALRHGGDGPVRVRLAWRGDRVEVGVRSPLPVRPLRGAAPDPARGIGHGIIGMRERAQLVGGGLEAAPDGGDFVVSASLPIGVRA